MLTPNDIQAHLARRLPTFRPTGAAQPITGGNLNYVWRVPGQPASVIVKAAPPYIASQPDIAFNPSRIVFEAECLKLLDADGELSYISTDLIRPPHFLDIDRQRHILVMEDVGELPHLGTRLLNGGARADWGRQLGNFIGKLHGRTIGRTDLARRFNNFAVQHKRSAIQYSNIAAFFDQARMRLPAGLATRVADLGRRLMAPGLCLTMGDLWPASILSDEKKLRLIDWELSHYGNPAQDIAHLAAHLWMHAQCACEERARAIKNLLHAFLAGYGAAARPRAASLLSSQVRTDCALHFGAEMLMRTLGPFARSYLYTRWDIEDLRVQQTITVATESILAGAHPVFNALNPTSQ